MLSITRDGWADELMNPAQWRAGAVIWGATEEICENNIWHLSEAFIFMKKKKLQCSESVCVVSEENTGIKH